jgi:hypothetical protein
VHGGQLSASTTPSLPDVAASLGFRNVELVRIVVDTDRTTASATGVVHRYPRTVPISLTAATSLAAAGARLRIVQAGDMTEVPAC